MEPNFNLTLQQQHEIAVRNLLAIDPWGEVVQIIPQDVVKSTFTEGAKKYADDYLLGSDKPYFRDNFHAIVRTRLNFESLRVVETDDGPVVDEGALATIVLPETSLSFIRRYNDKSEFAVMVFIPVSGDDSASVGQRARLEHAGRAPFMTEFVSVLCDGPQETLDGFIRANIERHEPRLARLEELDAPAIIKASEYALLNQWSNGVNVCDIV